jgi:hypothetical protein
MLVSTLTPGPTENLQVSDEFPARSLRAVTDYLTIFTHRYQRALDGPLLAA